MAQRTVNIATLKHALKASDVRAFTPLIDLFNGTQFIKGSVQITGQGDNLVMTDGAKMILLSPHEEEMLCGTVREWIFFQETTLEKLERQF